jgi:protein transport protein SEC24
LDDIPTRSESNPVTYAALGTLLRTAHAALVCNIGSSPLISPNAYSKAGYGGQVIAFQATRPTVGVGALQGQVDENKLFDTDKEKTLYVPGEKTWVDIGEDLAADGIGVNLVLAPNRFMDVASIGILDDPHARPVY